MILCVGPTPAAQRVMFFGRLTVDAVNRATRTLDGAAGKAVNVAKVLKALGARPLAAGFLGGARGDDLLRRMEALGVEHEFIKVEVPTRLCVTVIDEAAGTQTELVEESRAVRPEDYDRLLTVVERRLPQARALIMSGTLTPSAPADFYRRCTRLARQAGLLSVVDAKGAPLIEALKEKPDVIKPNRVELATTAGRDLEDERAVYNAVREMMERGARQVIVTAGPEPVLAFQGQTSWRITGPAIGAVNPIGSGDSFTAALVWRLTSGDDLSEACRWGAAAGIANALTEMAGEVTRGEVERWAAEVQVERVPA